MPQSDKNKNRDASYNTKDRVGMNPSDEEMVMDGT